MPRPTYSPYQRFYASAPPTDPRRSFWRKSINPADIGVALSPGKVEDASPRSASSEKSVSRLPSKSEWPSTWPAALMHFPPPPKSIPGRPGKAVPMFDENVSSGSSNGHPTLSVHAPYETRLPQLQRQQTQASYSRPVNPVPRVSIQAPYETKLTGLQQPIAFSRGLPAVNPENRVYNAERARGAAITGRIPLTPIYDNGNFATTPQGRPVPSAYRWDTPESMSQLSRPVVQAFSQVSSQPQTGLNISNATAQQPPPRKISLHRSVASDSTTFEEDTTPEEEVERQLRIAHSRTMDEYLDRFPSRAPEERSPIKDLAYPRVPRPAAVSRQAQEVPRPLAGRKINTAESAPVGVTRGLSRRLELNRAGQSYLFSSSTSSSAGAPSLLAQRRIGQQKDLRIKTPNSAANALNSRWQVSTQPVPPPPAVRKDWPVTALQASSSLKDTSPKARVTPKTNSRGDLYLTVED